MEKLPKQVYTSEFRQQAVAMIERDKVSVAEVSRKLSISQKTLANWVKRARDGKLRWSRFDGHQTLFNNRQIKDEKSYHDHHDRCQDPAQIR